MEKLCNSLSQVLRQWSPSLCLRRLKIMSRILHYISKKLVILQNFVFNAAVALDFGEQKQVIVMTADLRCPDGRKRISEVLSRMDEDTWSVLVDSRAKTVTLSCRFGGNARRKSVSTGEKLQSVLLKNYKSWKG